MKHIIALTILSAFALIAVTSAANVSWGYSKPYERLLHREIVTEKKKFLRIVAKDVNYPTWGNVQKAIISRVVVTDQQGATKGGNASLRSGGPGSSYVQIHLKSARNHRLDFIVEIYGN